ncbi:MAG: putative conserved protein YndB, AHSA1/START domain [Chloroflexi bacterium]|jgi:uncharacterized protein YndB with AHSA1/START domain|nr:MAG: putative conserved protein YndB, AHSA1/START domain [Chloroflexota bacterium]
MAPTDESAEALTEIERELDIAASPETVFSLLTDSREQIRWMGTEASLEPYAGGLYRVNCTGNDVALGEFVEVVPYSRVVFTFGWEGPDKPVPPGSSTVEITLTPTDAGTHLHFLHRGLPTPAAEQFGQGWDHFLERLQIVGDGGEPGRDPWATTPAETAADG